MIRKQFIFDFHNELIIDNFAGGGGASTGIELALGRSVDIAINHDAAAIAMHKANHPQTEHHCESVWDVNPREVTQGRPVGLVWLSPDCKHFSKAKGGKPVEKKIRGLAWITLRWAATVKPRVIMLENVEEFKTWGPLDKEGKPIKQHQGRTFNSFKNALARHGYHVEHRELRACDYDVPTIRKRLFLIARRDGLPIVWPEATNADPKSDLVKSGKLKPFRTAAECIDWSIPCPSIFERKKELAEATQRRVAKGIMRYVVNNRDPFIVTMAHGEGAGKTQRWGKGIRSTKEPLPTLTASGGYGLASPVIIRNDMPLSNSQCNYPIDDPLRTLTSTGGMSIVAPFINEHANASNQRVNAADEPLRTQCAQVKGGHFSVVAPVLAEVGYGERQGQQPRAQDIEKPLGTIVGSSVKHALVAPVISTYYGDKSPDEVRGISLDKPLQTQTTENRHALVSSFLAKNYTGVVGSSMEEPVHTVTSVDHNSHVAVFMTKFRSGSVGSAADEPIHTLTAGGEPARDSTGNVHGLVTANIVRQFGNSDANSVVDPMGTVVAGGGGKTLLSASSIVKMRGTNTGHATDEPLHTLSAGGTHFAEVQAFLIKYYGTDQDPKMGEPLHTVTTKDRFGLVTVNGEDYQIVDIGLRMLQPRELFRAQGFPDSYVIGDDASQGLTLTKSDQVRMVGNSVCPPLAAALVKANLADSMAYREGKAA